MKGRNRSRRAIWLRVAFTLALGVTAHALGAGSASAATPAAANSAGGPSSGTPIVLGALTSQRFPAVFKLAPNGRKLTVAAIALNMTCTSGNRFVLGDEFDRIPIGIVGHLQVTYSPPAPASGPNGETYTWTDSLRAKLNRAHTELSGVWDLTVNYTFTDGSSDACSSGPVRFLATS